MCYDVGRERWVAASAPLAALGGLGHGSGTAVDRGPRCVDVASLGHYRKDRALRDKPWSLNSLVIFVASGRMNVLHKKSKVEMTSLIKPTEKGSHSSGTTQ